MTWWDTDWQHRFIYEIPNENLPDGEELADFPFHIDLGKDAPANFWSHVKSDGSDVRVVDRDGTQITGCHLEGWDYDNQKGHLWCKKTVAQDTGSNTDWVYVYYGNDEASADWDKEGTYNSAYKMVQHLDEASGQHLDATANGNDSNAVSVTDQDAVGNIDGADEFDLSNKYIRIPDDPEWDLPNGQLTVGCWMYPHTNTPGAHMRLVRRPGSSVNCNWGITILASSGYLNGVIRLRGGDYVGSLLSEEQVAVNEWQYVVLTWDGSNIELFHDGVSKGSDSLSGTIWGQSDPLYIGAGNTTADEFDGLIDEVRISNVARSSEWIAFAYLSDKGEAGTAGEEESQEAPAAQAYAFIM
jgi:hypothetical protein